MLKEISAPVANSVSSATAMPRSVRSESPQVATLRKAQEEVTSNLPPQAHARVAEAVEAINAHLQRVSRNLKFSVDQDSGRVVVKVVDQETDTVIRQMPSEEALAISHALDKLQGLIIERKA
jgi:flagellar protein FlaG